MPLILLKDSVKLSFRSLPLNCIKLLRFSSSPLKYPHARIHTYAKSIWKERWIKKHSNKQHQSTFNRFKLIIYCEKYRFWLQFEINNWTKHRQINNKIEWLFLTRIALIVYQFDHSTYSAHSTIFSIWTIPGRQLIQFIRIFSTRKWIQK